MDLKHDFNRFWEFLKEDSWPSFFVSLVLIIIFIKLIFFPILSFLTGSSLPVVIVESCSMHHSGDWNMILQNNLYSNNGISQVNVSDFVLRNGFNKGDIIFVLGPKNVKVGDVIIFNGGRSTPIIHRVISIRNDSEGDLIYSTKGDNYITNAGQITPGCNAGFCWSTDERNIASNQIVGKAVFRIPLVGWIKLIFFDWRNSVDQRGFCK
jgi:signal peptidase I